MKTSNKLYVLSGKLSFKYAVIALLITYNLLLTTSLQAQERFVTLTDTVATGINAYGLRATNLKGAGNTITYVDPTGTVRRSTTYLTDMVLTSGTYANPAWITSLNIAKITGVPAGGILYGRVDGTVGSSSQFTYDSATGRATVTGNFNTYNGYSVTNNSSGASANSDFIAINNVGMAGSFGVTGSNYNNIPYANKTIVASNGGMVLSVDNNLQTGGTDSLFFYVGGFQTTPFIFTPSGNLILPNGGTVSGGSGGSGGSGSYVTTTKYTSDSTASRNLINANTINKLDSFNVTGNSLKQYKQGSVTKSIPIARFNFTGLADGQYVRYRASDSSFINVAGMTGSGDSIRVLTAFPTTGNIVIRSDIANGRLYFLANGYWKGVSVTDSTLAGINNTEATAYFNRLIAAGYTPTNIEKIAWDSFVSNAKNHGYYTKLAAAYPYLGLATGDNLNALSSSFNITWTGGVTHSASGVTFNGSTGYGNTGLTPSASLTNNSTSFGFYSANSAAEAGIDIGVEDANNYFEFRARYTDNQVHAQQYNATVGEQILTGSTDASGFWVSTRTSSTFWAVYRNGASLATNTFASTKTPPTLPVYIGADNINGTVGAFSTKNHKFGFIGFGLTATDVSNLNADLSTFLTAIGR